MHRLLPAIQNNLAALYETPIAHCVSDFLITDARVAAALEPQHAPRSNTERVLLRQSADSLDISLYIDNEILNSLASSDPYARLNAENLNDFLIALEGVSHFNYIVWNAVHGRQITQLELELQAEVDKFITAMMLIDEQGGNADVEGFHGALFDAVIFADSASSISGQRYREANHFAGKYCKRLTRRFPAQHREPSFMNEIRRFYRLPQNQKIRLINQH